MPVVLRVTVRNRFGQETTATVNVEVAAPTPARSEPRRISALSKRVRLGQILVEAGVLTQADLQRALEEQRRTGERLGTVLRTLGLGSQEAVARALAQQLGIEHAHLYDVAPEEAALLLLPEPFARRHQVIPLRVEGRALVLGMVDPVDILAADDVRRLTGLEIIAAVITHDDFQRAIGRYPSAELTAEALVDEITSTVVSPVAGFEPPAEPDEGLRTIAAQAPVIRLANLILLEAVRKKASDIHIEPMEERLRIRYRIDGSLYVTMTPPLHVHQALVSRIKIMANLNIAEHRAPQDGRIDLRVEGREINLRVSTVPTTHGEKVVMRVLDRRGAVVALDQLGLAPHDAQRIDEMIKRTYGIILVTGPTGSGKTTSLYAMLNRLNRPEINIMTIEDPIEYQLEGINQVAINPRAGLTFAQGLRSFLRQDPDIIMVGEIRDHETARIAIQSALTGHLVLSTLHTNDAPGAVIRLVDMGVEPFLVASSITGVIGQRLVRILCDRCRESYEPSRDLLWRLGIADTERSYTFYRKVGCPACNQTGYRGRTGIYEVLYLDEKTRALILQHDGASLREAAVASGMRTLQQDGVAKVIAGVTSVDELFRTVFVEEDRRRRVKTVDTGERRIKGLEPSFEAIQPIPADILEPQ